MDIEISFALPFLAIILIFSLSLKITIHSLMIAEKIKYLSSGLWRFLAKATIGLVMFGMFTIAFLVVCDINNPKKIGEEGNFMEFVEAMRGLLLKITIAIATFSVVAVVSFVFYFFRKIKLLVPKYNLSAKHKICLAVIGTIIIIELITLWVVVRNYNF